MKSRIGTKEEWLAARLALLQKEKEQTCARDELARLRQGLPWVKVEKDYVFNSTQGDKNLDDLFAGKSQLIIYHFMFDPDWDAGCKACSFVADHFDPLITHISQRDVAFASVSKAPLEKLNAFKKRMGWDFEWVSSFDNSFNVDFHVTFTEQQCADGVYYNFREDVAFPEKEAPGASVFAKNEDGTIFHTYSIYGRGLEDFLAAYRWLDIVPKGRDENNLSYGMEWVKLRDLYE